MTLSTDTIRTVIEIVPGWTIEQSNLGDINLIVPPFIGNNLHGSVLGWRLENPHQGILDALAAAAVRVVDEKVQCVITSASTEVYEVWHRDKRGYVEGKGRTNNTLEAIAEFVRSGGFESE